jgi:hypothetical protein
MTLELPWTAFRNLRGHAGKLLLLVFCLSISSGCVTQQTTNRSLPISQAQLSLAEARKTRSDPKTAVGYYLDAAEAAVRSTTSASANETTDARLIYNSACQEMAVLLQSNTQLWNRTESIDSSDRVYRLHFDAGSRQKGTWDPTYFDFFRTPKQLHEKVPTEKRRTGGWGGVLAGIHKPADPRKQFFPLVGVSVPVTATVDFASPRSGAKKVRDVTFALRDPTRMETVKVAGTQRPLAADFAAPIAYYPNPGLLGLQAMLRPAKYRERSGLYILEPYDPDRIPLVFVHGLLSIPQMWVPTISGIESDPQLRGRFQFWVFAYPTGDPVALSALRLRESLAQIYQLYPQTKGMVIISHSMGGLLSRMQSTHSGRAIWDAVFRHDADRLYASLPPDDLAKKALVFDANPRVERIVFICVPHRGSDLAINWIGSIGISLISLPGTILSQAGSAVTTSLQKNLGFKHLPTGINGLSPRSPVLRSLDTLPIAAPYHSIIGDRGRGDTPNSSDGVVAYWSSHLSGAQSELIVPGPHGSFALPQTIKELKRILHLHLAAVGHSRVKNTTKTSLEELRHRNAAAHTEIVKLIGGSAIREALARH